MPIRITCPSCSATLSVKDENAGRAVKCPKCDGVIPVPSPAAPPPPPDPVSPPAPGAFDDLDDEPPSRGAMAKSSSRSPSKSKSKSSRDDYDDEDDDYDDRPRSRTRAKSGGGLGEYLTFRKMIVPVVIQIIFWFLVLVVLGLSAAGAIFSLMTGKKEGVIVGIAVVVIAAPLYILLIRMYCEVLIVIFRMNDTLSEIRDALTRRD